MTRDFNYKLTHEKSSVTPCHPSQSVPGLPQRSWGATNGQLTPDAPRRCHHRARQDPPVDLPLLKEPTPSGASKQEKVYEFLMTFAEEFDVSPDLVEPGAGYKRSRIKRNKRSAAGDDFFDSLPKKKSKSPKVSPGASATQPTPVPLSRASTVLGTVSAASPSSTSSDLMAIRDDSI